MRPTLDLDQLHVFLTVEAEGSFSAAARQLGRAQSAVTYAIQELEADVRVPLFDRTAYRPTLSEAGRALLPRARRVLREVAALEAQASGMADGLEPSLSLVVDAMFPMRQLTETLVAFQAEFPTVTTRVHVETMGAVADMVIGGGVDLGLATAFFATEDLLHRQRVGGFELVPVCAPTHPLASAMSQRSGPIPMAEVQDRLQLVLSDRSPRTRDLEHGVASTLTWRLADLGAKHAMLRAGLGWGSLPRHLVADDLADGRLIELKLDRWVGSDRLPWLELILVRRMDRILGPAGRWLRARLAPTGPEEHLSTLDANIPKAR